MFKNLTYLKKVKLLLIGGIVFLFISYLFAFKRTINLYSDYREIKEKLKLVDSAPQTIAGLQSQLNGIDKIISKNNQGGMDTRFALLGVASEYCQRNRTSLTEMPKSLFTQESDYNIETITLVMEGSFFNLLKFVYQLERSDNIGKVASVEFKTINDIITKENKLIVSIYIQTVKKNEK